MPYAPEGTVYIPNIPSHVYYYKDGVLTYDAQVATGDRGYTYGYKKTATSAKVVIDGLRWSRAHNYSRSAMVRKQLGGGRSARSRRVHLSSGNPDYDLFEEVIGPHFPNEGMGQLTGGSPHFTSSYVPRDLSTNEWNRLQTELLNKVGNRQWSMGEALGESLESINMVASSAAKIAGAALALKRGQFGKIPGILGVSRRGIKSGKSPSNIWLEYQYGWKPLMNDIADAHKVFTNGLNTPQIVRGFRQFTRDEFDYSSLSKRTGNVTGQYILNGTSTSSVRSSVYYKLKNEYLTYLQQLGIINPAEIAWALMPYSFVIDWLVPVQATLEACTATVGLDFIDGSYTLRAKANATIATPWSRNFHGSSSSEWVYEEPSPTWGVEIFGMRRVVMGKPKPALYVKSPFSTNHVISALALITQLRR